MSTQTTFLANVRFHQVLNILEALFEDPLVNTEYYEPGKMIRREITGIGGRIITLKDLVPFDAHDGMIGNWKITIEYEE